MEFFGWQACFERGKIECAERRLFIPVSNIVASLKKATPCQQNNRLQNSPRISARVRWNAAVRKGSGTSVKIASGINVPPKEDKCFYTHPSFPNVLFLSHSWYSLCSCGDQLCHISLWKKEEKNPKCLLGFCICCALYYNSHLKTALSSLLLVTAQSQNLTRKFFRKKIENPFHTNPKHIKLALRNKLAINVWKCTNLGIAGISRSPWTASKNAAFQNRSDFLH